MKAPVRKPIFFLGHLAFRMKKKFVKGLAFSSLILSFVMLYRYHAWGLVWLVDFCPKVI